MTGTNKAESTQVVSAQGFTLWFRADRSQKWEAVARAATFTEAVSLIGIGARRNGEWFPLVATRHPDQCGSPDKPLKKPAAMATAELWGDS